MNASLMDIGKDYLIDKLYESTQEAGQHRYLTFFFFLKDRSLGVITELSLSCESSVVMFSGDLL